MGYLIHPTIIQYLPSDARIADLGTGNGVWLLDVESERAQSFALDVYNGFDISDSQFPRQYPGSVNFHIADIKKPFPKHFHSKFDLVHVRLLVLALDPEDWALVLSNVLQLCKPGGYIQWEEADYQPLSRVTRNHQTSRFTALTEGFERMLQIADSRMPHCHEPLIKAFHDGEVESVEVDSVTADRLPELRELATRTEIKGLQGMIKQQRLDNVADALSEEESERLIRAMFDEASLGGYSNYYMYCVIGRR